MSLEEVVQLFDCKTSEALRARRFRECVVLRRGFDLHGFSTPNFGKMIVGRYMSVEKSEHVSKLESEHASRYLSLENPPGLELQSGRVQE